MVIKNQDTDDIYMDNSLCQECSTEYFLDNVSSGCSSLSVNGAMIVSVLLWDWYQHIVRRKCWVITVENIVITSSVYIHTFFLNVCGLPANGDVSRTFEHELRDLLVEKNKVMYRDHFNLLLLNCGYFHFYWNYIGNSTFCFSLI